MNLGTYIHFFVNEYIYIYIYSYGIAANPDTNPNNILIYMVVAFPSYDCG